MQDRLGASPAYQLIHTFWAAVDWIYPPRCGGCRTEGARWCATCDAQAAIIHQSAICPVCGIPQTDSGLCKQCRSDQPPYKALRSWAVYQGPVREAIHSLKYHSDLGLSEIFAQKLQRLFVTENWNVDLVTAVPLSRDRIKDRGFNQSDFLARTLAYTLCLPYRPAAIKRVRETQSQVGLNASERHQNVRDAFLADPHTVRNNRVLVIDDVTTTGATMSECARACLDQGAASLYGLTVARAVLEHSG